MKPFPLPSPELIPSLIASWREGQKLTTLANEHNVSYRVLRDLIIESVGAVEYRRLARKHMGKVKGWRHSPEARAKMSAAAQGTVQRDRPDEVRAAAVKERAKSLAVAVKQAARPHWWKGIVRSERVAAFLETI